MTTETPNGLPEIKWEDTKFKFMYSDIDEREERYVAVGYDKDGQKYTGTAIFVHEELAEIIDIEKDEDAQHTPNGTE